METTGAVPALEPPLEKPSHLEIAQLAHALWEARGGGDGSAEEDWYNAERLLRA